MSTRDYDGWCIQTCTGRSLLWTCRRTRVQCIAAFNEYLGQETFWRWRRLARRFGYRCVPVKLVEVQR